MGFTPAHIQNALKTLQDEGVLLYPSDTIWGVGCDARSDKGVEAVYALKKRSDAKALICLVADREMLEAYVGTIDPRLLPYLEEERPTTVIYPQVKGLSSHLGAADGSVGIRIAKEAFCSTLIRAFGAPIVSTSANIAGAPSPSEFKEIDQEIVAGVDHIVPFRQGEKQTQASRIIQLLPTGEINILRH